MRPRVLLGSCTERVGVTRASLVGAGGQVKHISDDNASTWPLSLQVTHSVRSFLVAKYVERLMSQTAE
jgi:hypothetical protein